MTLAQAWRAVAEYIDARRHETAHDVFMCIAIRHHVELPADLREQMVDRIVLDIETSGAAYDTPIEEEPENNEARVLAALMFAEEASTR